MIKRISIDTAAELIESDAVLIVDIRDPNSFEQGHIASAVRIDNNNIQSFLQKADKSKTLIVCCYHGNSSQQAAEVFYQQGFEQSCSMDGGMSEWSLTKEVITS